jgi:purine-binding chemotaxis protein CheW
MQETKQFCTFYLDHFLYGIPVEKVQEVIREQPITRIPTAPPVVAGLINLRGKVVTAIDLRKRLGLAQNQIAHGLMNVVVSTDDATVSFLVDTIGGVVGAPDDCYEGVPETIQGEARKLISGVYKLKDELLHVLDTEKSAQAVAASDKKGNR